MADTFDQASETEALELSVALLAQQAKAAATVHLQATGECLNPTCGEPMALPGQLFCGPKCAHQHAKYSK